MRGREEGGGGGGGGCQSKISGQAFQRRVCQTPSESRLWDRCTSGGKRASLTSRRIREQADVRTSGPNGGLRRLARGGTGSSIPGGKPGDTSCDSDPTLQRGTGGCPSLTPKGREIRPSYKRDKG